MKKQTAIFFYVLSAYVVLQFLWWGFHLIELSTELGRNEPNSNRRVLMVIGEGAVFFLILLLGIWRIQTSIQKDLRLSERHSNFLLSVTHELKTPLASNKLYLQTLLKHTSLSDAKKEEIIAQALNENKRLEAMIENILTATRLDNHHFELNKSEIDFSNFLLEIAEKWSRTRNTVQADVEKGIRFKVDPFVIDTIFNNLLENAHKYAGKNAVVTIYARIEGNHIVCGVKDDGPGVPEQFRNEIFEKFTRIGNEETRIEKGTGLGLYIVKELVEMKDGNIVCLSNGDKGTNFEITLPYGK
jgi:signal transduction histidine kinase